MASQTIATSFITASNFETILLLLIFKEQKGKGFLLSFIDFPFFPIVQEFIKEALYITRWPLSPVRFSASVP